MTADAATALQRAEQAYEQHDVDGLVAHLSAAVRAFTAAGDQRGAAMVCVRLGDVFANALGNTTAARAWFVRARRLIENDEPCVEQGWVAVAAMGCLVDDPDELLASADLALDRARRFGDVNLETNALADAGLAHVQAGRIGEGMRLLDEAMALACGPTDDRDVVAKSVCSFFTACYVSYDYGRAESWTELLARRGLLTPDSPNGTFLSSHCDSVRAALLIETGHWSEAEALLLESKQRFESFMKTASAHCDIGLAELRLRQGRLADAEALLLGKEHWISALLPSAQLHLARGDHALARTTAARGLRAVGGDCLRAIELLIVIVDASLAAGDVDAARQACEQLATRTARIDVPAAIARSAIARARNSAGEGRHDEAVAILAPAVDALDPVRSAWLRTSLLFELAELRRCAGDMPGAELDLRQAAATLSTLDVVVPEAWRSAVRAMTGAVEPATAMLVRDGRWWTATLAGERVRLPDTKGLRYVADLIARPGAERHALDLVDLVEGVDPERAIDRRVLGDAGELLDGRARAAYRRRIEELGAAAAEALEVGHLEAAEAAQDELDQLVAQLAAAFGIGGRRRSAGSAAEKARLNVTRAIRGAVSRLAEALPEAGAALDRGISTGIYCCYRPAPTERITWIVQR